MLDNYLPLASNFAFWWVLEWHGDLCTLTKSETLIVSHVNFEWKPLLWETLFRFVLHLEIGLDEIARIINIGITHELKTFFYLPFQIKPSKFIALFIKLFVQMISEQITRHWQATYEHFSCFPALQVVHCAGKVIEGARAITFMW